ncbi:MAG: DNA/RNA helicase domain-containing protein [Erysipelotrichaceae bacterium]
MLVYQGIKGDFLLDVLNDRICDKIHNEYKRFFGKSNESQIRSWKNSMEYMNKVLSDAEIPNEAGIAIEYNIPTTSKRVDFIVSGFDQNNKGSVIIIELKQWESCEKEERKDGIVRTYLNRGVHDVTHPSYQAYSYASLIYDFNETVRKELIDLYPCAYLHNYKLKENDDLVNNIYHEYIDVAPVFCSGDVVKLRTFIKKHIKYGDNKELLYSIDNGKIRPSKRLQDTLSSMLKGNKEFKLIDEQKVIFEEALLLDRAYEIDKKKRVLIIEGGPGTGKTVLAINLLVEILNRSKNVAYVTKNSAPREVFYKKLAGDFKKNHAKNLFQGSGSFISTEANVYDALLVDEAHRLNGKSGMFKNKGENQIKEIINSAKLSIFFIDENQRVTMDDIGDQETIEKYAKEFNAEVEHVILESQFRCNGSDGYLAWLDNILEIKETANIDFDFDYDFKVFDDPNELREAIIEKNKINNKSRIVAGYCWDWNKNTRKDSGIFDVTIPGYNFGMSWNLDNTSTWAIDEESVNEIGCIHTCQGLEFDYVGVIIGDDIQLNGEHIITDFTKRAKTDQSLKGIKKLYQENSEEALKQADLIIKNTYRTLMTRGMKGCYIYCTNKELARFFNIKRKGCFQPFSTK